MPLLGKAAVAMWWDMAAVHRAEFEDWHSHEHFPERLRIPGFRRGSRWASATGGDGFFTLYELQSYDTLTSPAYFARLNDPTPWSLKMMRVPSTAIPGIERGAEPVAMISSS